MRKETMAHPLSNDFTVNVPKDKAQYFKIIVKNPKVLPKWHEGAGNPLWVFVDEIVID